MIVGIGIDAVEVGWVKKQLLIDGWKESVFSIDEIEYCESKRYPARHYGARMAAREAFLKALGTGAVTIDEFRMVRVSRDEIGKPSLGIDQKLLERMNGLGADKAHVSLSHTESTAVAVVILES